MSLALEGTEEKSLFEKVSTLGGDDIQRTSENSSESGYWNGHRRTDHGRGRCRERNQRLINDRVNPIVLLIRRCGEVPSTVGLSGILPFPVERSLSTVRFLAVAFTARLPGASAGRLRIQPEITLFKSMTARFPFETHCVPGPILLSPKIFGRQTSIISCEIRHCEVIGGISEISRHTRHSIDHGFAKGIGHVFRMPAQELSCRLRLTIF
jgi:hypothetical protein